jgi:hypothetical protein
MRHSDCVGLWRWSVVLISYPKEFADRSIVQEIRLEVGALAAWTPATAKAIQSYASVEFPHLFEQAETTVLTVLPDDTTSEDVIYELYAMSSVKAGLPGLNGIGHFLGRYYK